MDKKTEIHWARLCALFAESLIRKKSFVKSRSRKFTIGLIKYAMMAPIIIGSNTSLSFDKKAPNSLERNRRKKIIIHTVTVQTVVIAKRR